MDTRYDFGTMVQDLVYVKEVAVSSLPEEVQKQVQGIETVFAVHDAEGTQLALVANRNLAFLLARQHDKVPLAVH
ncbi:MAG: DUF1150 family protein [Rubellimicrobium sp.]|nr:DUF1150 family protein [Rubellimicrobium sp.]